MTSSLYLGRVMHHRLAPFRRRFVHGLYLFSLDIDELDDLDRRLRFFSRNRWNLFTFRDRDHFGAADRSVRENLGAFLRTQGVDLAGGKVYLVTHLRVLGYVFNPVSFFFCFDAEGRPLGVVPEVGNTFGEFKPFFIGPDRLSGGTYRESRPKLFYVSPFIDLDAAFEFHLTIPDGSLRIRIDDRKDGERFFISTLTGERAELTDRMLLFVFVRYPLLTLRVIGLIHYHAFILFLRKLPWNRKADHPELQQGVYQWNK